MATQRRKRKLHWIDFVVMLVVLAFVIYIAQRVGTVLHYKWNWGAVAPFIAETPSAADYAREITAVIASDLSGTGLFRDIPKSAYISQVESFDAPVAYADWKAINAEALVVGTVTLSSDNRLLVKFRLFDIFTGAPLGDGLQFAGGIASCSHHVVEGVLEVRWCSRHRLKHRTDLECRNLVQRVGRRRGRRSAPGWR